MTGVFGPGPRDMAVCHAVARPTHEYKNPLPLSQVRAGGQTWLVSGGRRDPWLAHKVPSFPPSPPSSPQRAFFRRMDRWCGAAGCTPLLVSRHYGRGHTGKRMWCKARWSSIREMDAPETRGERETDGPLFVHCCGAGPSAGQGREVAVSQAPYAGPWKAGEDMGKGRFSTGDGQRRSQGHARHDEGYYGAVMASPSP